MKGSERTADRTVERRNKGTLVSSQPDRSTKFERSTVCGTDWDHSAIGRARQAEDEKEEVEAEKAEEEVVVEKAEDEVEADAKDEDQEGEE